MTCAGGMAVTSTAANRGLVHDCQALLGARDGLRGTAALNWAANTAISSWDGVTTGGTPERVTGLALAGKSLTGSIPTELGILFELISLDLSSNSFTGEIPREIGWLFNLSTLQLSGNSLSRVHSGGVGGGCQQRPQLPEPALLPTPGNREPHRHSRRDHRRGELGRGAQHQQVPGGASAVGRG